MTCSVQVVNIYHAEMLRYTESIKSKGDNLLFTQIPEKIVTLNHMLTNDKILHMDLAEIHPPVDLFNVRIRKRKHPNFGMDRSYFAQNRVIGRLTDIVKPYIRQLVEDCNLLKMWILYKMPKVEIGHNLGVSIQSVALAKTQTVEQDTAAFYDQINKYYSSRGQLLSKVCKWPDVQDYQYALRELDEVQYLAVSLILTEIRNRYCNIHDFILKNLEKIECPRSYTANESLY